MTDTEVPEVPEKRNHAEPLSIETRVERYLDSRKTFLQSRRMRQALNAEYGRTAAAYRGAVKKARYKKLNKLAAQVKGYSIPEYAQQ